MRYTQLSDELFPVTGYTLSGFQPGSWTMILDANTQTPTAGIPVAVLGSLQSDLRLDPQVIETPVNIGDRAAIAVRLSASGAPIPGAMVTGHIELPGGRRVAITLRDDGQSGDGAPGDGVYGYQFTPKVPGIYSAVLSVAPSASNPAGRSALWVITIDGYQVALPMVRR